MEIALLVAVVVAGVAACPLMAWVQRRRGRAGCCPSARASRDGRDAARGDQDLAVLEAERARVRERIRALERDAARGAGGG
jgi:hypothetical protein